MNKDTDLHDWNVYTFFSILIRVLMRKFHDFLFYLTDQTLMQDLAVEANWPMFHEERFALFAISWMQFILFFFQHVEASFRVHLQ